MEQRKLDLFKLGLDLFRVGLEIDNLQKELETMLENGIEISSFEFNEKYRILSDKKDHWAQMEQEWLSLEATLVDEKDRHKEFDYLDGFIDGIAEKFTIQITDIDDTL